MIDGLPWFGKVAVVGIAWLVSVAFALFCIWPFLPKRRRDPRPRNRKRS